MRPACPAAPRPAQTRAPGTVGEREVLTHEAFGTAARELASETLELVRDSCAGHVPAVRTAVVYEKPQSVVRCDHVWRRTDRRIDFPWSSQPPVRTRGGRPAR